MLNPDGAEAYTRVNAQGIDLNRDVIDVKALESQVLQQVLKKVNPQYCFNLHDQRTIFSVAPGRYLTPIAGPKWWLAHRAQTVVDINNFLSDKYNIHLMQHP